VTVPDAPPSPRPATESGERWSLLDRRDFLRRSLEDADLEHDAGDLGDTDYALLRHRDEVRLADVEAQLEALDTDPGRIAPSSRSRSRSRERVPARQRTALSGPARIFHRPRRRVWMGVVGTLAVIAGGVVLVVNLTTARLPGQVATGSLTLTGVKLVEQQLDQAALEVGEGHLVTALQLYKEVLSESPRQSTALAEGGWLEWESGKAAGNASLIAKGRASVSEATRAAPKFYAGHLYLGTIELDQGDDTGALTQYKLFLSDHPQAKWIKDYAPEIRKAYAAVAQPLPPTVPAE